MITSYSQNHSILARKREKPFSSSNSNYLIKWPLGRRNKNTFPYLPTDRATQEVSSGKDRKECRKTRCSQMPQYSEVLRDAFHHNGHSLRACGDLTSPVFWVTFVFFYFQIGFWDLSSTGSLMTNSRQLETESPRVCGSERASFPANSWKGICPPRPVTFAFRLQLCLATAAPFTCHGGMENFEAGDLSGRRLERGSMCVCTSVLAWRWVRLGASSSCAASQLAFLANVYCSKWNLLLSVSISSMWPWTERTLHWKLLAVFWLV